jgi:hypothetical protein
MGDCADLWRLQHVVCMDCVLEVVEERLVGFKGSASSAAGLPDECLDAEWSGLLTVWLTPGFMPPERRPCDEQTRIQPESFYPIFFADACGDKSARPSARSLYVISLACANGPCRGRSSAARRRTIPSRHYHQQRRPDPLIRQARNAVEPAGTSESEIGVP